MTVPPLSSIIPGWRGSTSHEPPLRLGVVEGQGIGPEVVAGALTVLDSACRVLGIDVEVVHSGDIGGVGPHGLTLDDRSTEFYEGALSAGVPVLTGPAGGRFVYELRAEFDLFVKLVPVRPLPALADASIVRPERIRDVDVLVVRDNAGGLYQGGFGRRDSGRVAFQEAVYDIDQVDRVLHVAARAAASRQGRLAVVTKPGGVPAISALWRERAEAAPSSGVCVEVIEVDNACFQLVADPHRFDVVAAPNMLGDVIADTAGIVLGSRGLCYSANFGSDGRAVYQTGHGAAQDLAGCDVANPLAQILSLAWLLRESLGLPTAAQAIEDAVVAALSDGLRTADIAGPTSTVVGTRALAQAVADRIAIPSAEPAEA